MTQLGTQVLLGLPRTAELQHSGLWVAFMGLAWFQFAFEVVALGAAV